ncbi:hypothetical protein [Nocardioides scoriae]|nr:hypothetical protein [Nocardioides scoriae]
MEAQVVGYVKKDEMFPGLVDAFIAACRTGLPVHRRPGHSTFSGAHTGTTVDVLAQRRRLQEGVILEARKKIKNAIRREIEVEDDDETAELYRGAAAEAREELRSARAALAQIEADAKVPTTTGPFDALTHVIVPAMARLKMSGGVLSQEEVQALEAIIPSFSMELRSGKWWAIATVRINTVEGVADLGPFEWAISGRARGTARVAAQLDTVPDVGAASRRRLFGDLVRSGRVTEDAATILRNAPFVQLPYLVLHSVRGEELPQWMGEEWREPRFVSWIVSIYTDPKFRWMNNGMYATVSYSRQFAATFAAKQEEFTVSDLAECAPIPRASAYHQMTRPSSTKYSKIRPFEPTLELVGVLPTGIHRHVMRGCKCVCGQVASIVTHVPEVPRDLLCDCGRMLDTERFGLDAAVRFPEEYKLLRLPFDECVDELTDRVAAQRDVPGAVGRRLMLLSDLLEDGATDLRIATALGGKGTSQSTLLGKLEQFGWLRRSDTRPAIWTYTDEGRAQAARFAADG